MVFLTSRLKSRASFVSTRRLPTVAYCRLMLGGNGNTSRRRAGGCFMDGSVASCELQGRQLGASAPGVSKARFHSKHLSAVYGSITITSDSWHLVRRTISGGIMS